MSRPLTALFDANVFFGAALRSLVMQTASSRVYMARWSDSIHEEWIAAVQKERREIDRGALDRVRRLMDRSVPDALVTGYEHLIPMLELPDAEDRHILAAALTCQADYLVTFNEGDFPPEALRHHGCLRVCHPDLFLLELADRDEVAFIKAVAADLGHYEKPPLTVEAYAASLRRAGVPKTANYVLEAFSPPRP